jgi:carbon monoxide dehydrogenase subunit G
MIAAEHSLLVDADIEDVWEYVKDMRRWAVIVPGCEECRVIDQNDSLWVLKLGVGGFVRTVKVRVHVDEWAGPEEVQFSFTLDGDPVEGRGSYVAASRGPRQTEIGMQVRISGGGPMAPMWEAMGGPVLSRFARSFAGELKARIERAGGVSESRGGASTRVLSALLSGVGRWLQSIGQGVRRLLVRRERT